jgi:hypothetical protein
MANREGHIVASLLDAILPLHGGNDHLHRLADGRLLADLSFSQKIQRFGDAFEHRRRLARRLIEFSREFVQ